MTRGKCTYQAFICPNPQRSLFIIVAMDFAWSVYLQILHCLESSKFSKEKYFEVHLGPWHIRNYAVLIFFYLLEKNIITDYFFSYFGFWCWLQEAKSIPKSLSCQTKFPLFLMDGRNALKDNFIILKKNKK